MFRKTAPLALAIVTLLIAQVGSQPPTQPPSLRNDLPDYAPTAPAGPSSALPANPGGPVVQERMPSSGDVVLMNNCKIKAISEHIISASEAGRLTLGPTFGTKIDVDQIVAKTDDTIARHQQRVAYFAYQAERIKLETDIQIRYAQKQADVAKAKYGELKAANEKVPNAVSPDTLRRAKFEWDAAILGVEKANQDMEIAMAAAKVKLAEYEAAESMVKRHQFKSKVAGLIQEVLRREGEWVTPGEPIAKMVRMDKVRVMGYFPHQKAFPNKLKGAKVTIEIPVASDANGKPTKYATVQSEIMHVGVKVSNIKDYEIWAEIDNTEENDYWPGAHNVRMKLQLP